MWVQPHLTLGTDPPAPMELTTDFTSETYDRHFPPAFLTQASPELSVTGDTLTMGLTLKSGYHWCRHDLNVIRQDSEKNKSRIDDLEAENAVLRTQVC
jgi:hypothetical protein